MPVRSREAAAGLLKIGTYFFGNPAISRPRRRVSSRGSRAGQHLLPPLLAPADNAAMSELPSVEELIARLAKLDEERTRLIKESTVVRDQLLHSREEREASPHPAEIT